MLSTGKIAPYAQARIEGPMDRFAKLVAGTLRLLRRRRAVWLLDRRMAPIESGRELPPGLCKSAAYWVGLNARQALNAAYMK